MTEIEILCDRRRDKLGLIEAAFKRSMSADWHGQHYLTISDPDIGTDKFLCHSDKKMFQVLSMLKLISMDQFPHRPFVARASERTIIRIRLILAVRAPRNLADQAPAAAMTVRRGYFLDTDSALFTDATGGIWIQGAAADFT